MEFKWDSLMKVAIVGHGFVGKAVDYAIQHPKVEKMIIDPTIRK